MSSLVYGTLSRKRERAPKGKSTSEEPPGVEKHIDAIAALVPAEALAIHATVLGTMTESVPVVGKPGEMALRIKPENIGDLETLFYVLLVLSATFYALGHIRDLGPLKSLRKWDLMDWLRAAIPPLAFIAWSMGLKVGAFDAAFPGWNYAAKAMWALILSTVLLGASVVLAQVADQKDG